MQARVVRQLARRRAWALQPNAPACRRNSFIKQVMEQVKKDMEADAKLKKDWDSVQQSSQKLREHSSRQEERLGRLGEHVKDFSEKTSVTFASWREKAEGVTGAASSKFSQAKEDNEAIRKAAERLHQAQENAAAGSRAIFSRTKNVFGSVMDTTSKAFNKFGDADKVAAKTKQWKATRDQMAAAQAAKEAAEEAAASQAKCQGTPGDGEAAKEPEQGPVPPAEPADALVVSNVGSSTWDRFGGAGLRDMPFLNSVFENPLFDRLFGETEIAASIREMKEMDYTFCLEDFAEDIEHVVAPNIIQTYLEGDQDRLQMHCGEAAFAAVNASIKARKQQKLSLDTAILSGPREVELKGAKLMEQGPPCFIWTFNMQQVNCLRDAEGEIIEGAVDDIRTVCYAMAVNRHPELEKPGLEYPWQISELAILWNQPCF